jgi:hypothetical protein
MLDDVNDTVLVSIRVVITFKDAPEVWAVLANFPKEAECDEKKTPMLVFDLEMEMGKYLTTDQRTAEVRPKIRAICKSIPIAPELMKKIQCVFFG